jgi:hypothetical protein
MNVPREVTTAEIRIAIASAAEQMTLLLGGFIAGWLLMRHTVEE